MRLRAKSAVLLFACAAAVLGLALLAHVVSSPLLRIGALMLAAVIVIAAAAAQFVILVCPNCKRLAILTPRGSWATPGLKCRFCHKSY